MGILSVAADFAGQVGVNPRRVKVVTTDNLATITTAGYFNSLANWGYPLKPTDFMDIAYSFNAATGTATLDVLTFTFSNGVITAVQDVSTGNVAFTGAASVANALPVFSDTLGNIKAATTTVTLAQALVVAAPITSSTGNITSGASTDAGTFISFPSSAANGTFIFAAANAGGAFNTTISNGTMGQSSVITIPDPGAATSKFVLQDGTNTSVTATTATITNLKYGATPVAQVDPASCTITAAAGAANHSTITIQLKDGSGTNMARVIPFKVYLATDNTGLTLQSAASTGYSVSSGGVKDPTGSTTITQGLAAFSSATGGCVVDLLDTGKGTGNLILMLANGFKASAAITAGSYG